MAVWLEPLIKSVFLLLSASDHFPIKRRARQGSNAGSTTLDQAWYGGSLDQMARYGFLLRPIKRALVSKLVMCTSLISLRCCTDMQCPYSYSQSCSYHHRWKISKVYDGPPLMRIKSFKDTCRLPCESRWAHRCYQILKQPLPQSGRVVKDHAFFGHTVVCCLSFRNVLLSRALYLQTDTT